MPAEAVMAVRGLVVRPPRRYQQVSLAQAVKQRISPEFDARSLPGWIQQMVQLARPQPRLAQPLGMHQIDHLAGLLPADLLALYPLVMRLPADAEVTASPAHVQALYELLRQDLPKGFFTTRTP